MSGPARPGTPRWAGADQLPLPPSPPLTALAANYKQAAAQVAALAAAPSLRAQVGAAAREEVSLWDWRAATQHLLQVQYPLAMAAAAAHYGRTLGRVARAAQRDGGAAAAAPAPAA